jgi:biopolymer transport protein ExbD
MRLPLTGRFGIALIVVGSALLMYSIYWLAPRPLVALDMPVSLSPGRIRTGNVSVISVDDLYYIDIEFDRAPLRTATGCDPHSVLETQWTLSSDGTVLERGSSPWEGSGLTIGVLLPEKERYAFEAEIIPGASCLNARHPRLKIQTHPYPGDLYTILNWVSVWFVAIGFVLLIRSLLAGGLTEKPKYRIFPAMVLRNVVPFQRHRPIPLIKDLPDFGLVVGCLLYILVFIFIVIQPMVPQGLLVDIGERSVVALQKSPWAETLTVSVDGQGRFYVNEQPVPKEELQTKLREELEKRMVWIVYFEADQNGTFANAIYSFDIIQGLGAQVVWITPHIREELNREAVH